MKKINFKQDIDRLFIVVMAFLSVVAAVIFIFTNFMLPVPFAEIISICHHYSNAADPTVESAVSALIYGIIYFLSLLGCVTVALSKKKGPLLVRAGVSLVLVFDLIVHAYAFLFSSGYSWSYLVAAILEALLIISIFYKNLKEPENTEDNNISGSYMASEPSEASKASDSNIHNDKE